MSAKYTAIDAADFMGITLQGVHKHLKTKNLFFEKNQNRLYFYHDTAKKLFNINFSPKVIAFQIVKGGTGKTSLAYSVGVRANLYGARVLFIDLDQQANLTQALGISAEEVPVMIDIIKEGRDIREAIVSLNDGLDLIPSRIENAILDNTLMLQREPLDRVFKDRIRPLLNQYDLIIIDCPPALGQSVAAATLSSDMIIAPVTPEEFALSGLKISTEEISDIESKYNKKIELKLVLNKFDTRTSLSHEVLSQLIKHDTLSKKLFKTYVRLSQDFPNSVSVGQSVFDTLKVTSAKEDIDQLTREILGVYKGGMETVSLGSLENVA